MKIPESGWVRAYAMATLDSVLGSLVDFAPDDGNEGPFRGQ